MLLNNTSKIVSNKSYVLELVTGSGSNTCVSVDEFKQHQRIIGDDELDQLITMYIQAAENTFERWTNHVLLTKTYKLHYPALKAKSFYSLPIAPVSAMTMQYYNTDDILTAFTEFNFVSNDKQTYINLTEIPQASCNYELPIIFNITAGKAANAIDNLAKLAVLQIASQYYVTRETSQTDAVNELPITIKHILNSFKIQWTR